MTVELTPGGSRGSELPKLPAPVGSAKSALSAGVYRLFGERMRIAGLPLYC